MYKRQPYTSIHLRTPSYTFVYKLVGALIYTFVHKFVLTQNFTLGTKSNTTFHELSKSYMIDAILSQIEGENSKYIFGPSSSVMTVPLTIQNPPASRDTEIRVLPPSSELKLFQSEVYY